MIRLKVFLHLLLVSFLGLAIQSQAQQVEHYQRLDGKGLAWAGEKTTGGAGGTESVQANRQGSARAKIDRPQHVVDT